MLEIPIQGSVLSVCPYQNSSKYSGRSGVKQAVYGTTNGIVGQVEFTTKPLDLSAFCIWEHESTLNVKIWTHFKL